MNGDLDAIVLECCGGLDYLQPSPGKNHLMLCVGKYTRQAKTIQVFFDVELLRHCGNWAGNGDSASWG